MKANEQLAIFRRFAEASEQGFGIADLNGRITYVNPTLCRLMGEERPEDVIGKHFFDYVAKESQQHIRAEYIPTILREGRWTGEGGLLTRQGTVTPIFNSSFLLRDEQGKPAYLATIITDITERKQAEEALRQSEEKYRGLLEACPDAVVMTDLNGRILFASRQTWKLVGLSDREELVGQSVFDYVIEDDRRRLAENIPRLAETGVRRRHGIHGTSPRWNASPHGDILCRESGCQRATNRCHGGDSRHHGTQTGRGGIATRTSHPQTPAGIQRPRTTTDRLRNPRRAGPAIGGGDHAVPDLSTTRKKPTPRGGEGV